MKMVQATMGAAKPTTPVVSWLITAGRDRLGRKVFCIIMEAQELDHSNMQHAIWGHLEAWGAQPRKKEPVILPGGAPAASRAAARLSREPCTREHCIIP